MPSLKPDSKFTDLQSHLLYPSCHAMRQHSKLPILRRPSGISEAQNVVKAGTPAWGIKG